MEKILHVTLILKCYYFFVVSAFKKRKDEPCLVSVKKIENYSDYNNITVNGRTRGLIMRSNRREMELQ